MDPEATDRNFSEASTVGTAMSPDADGKRVEEVARDSDEKREEEVEPDSGSTSEEHEAFEPIRAGDAAELRRLATQFSSFRGQSYLSAKESNNADPEALERKDTLAGVNIGDPVIDPSNKDFNPYVWARMLLRLFDEEGVKLRRAGFTFQNLNVSGSGSALNLQKNVGSILAAPFRLNDYLRLNKGPEKQILRNFDGIVKSGEMLVVLGRPGSGCSTLLKTICGELSGLNLQKESVMHYNGIPRERMMKEFKGEVVYNQEVEKHFPHLTVGQTIEFAASARTPQNRVKGATRAQWAKHMAQVVMTIFGLSHTYNTKVGNDFIRGVSGGERKRVR